jgi:hypothetical protein
MPFRQSPIASRHSLSFRLCKSLALPISPPTEVSGYENEAGLKQAEKPKGASPDAPKNFSAAQKRCPPENFCFTIRYSPPFRHSLPFPDLPISRFADKIRLGRSLALPQ